MVSRRPQGISAAVGGPQPTVYHPPCRHRGAPFPPRSHGLMAPIVGSGLVAAGGDGRGRIRDICITWHLRRRRRVGDWLRRCKVVAAWGRDGAAVGGAQGGP